MIWHLCVGYISMVQAARQFWKKIVDKMKEGGFKLSEADPCILYKEDEKGSVTS